MKVSKFGKSRFSQFMRHNGVFVALAVGIAAVCIVGLYGAVQGKNVNVDPIQERPAEQIVTNQPDERTETTTTTSSSSTTSTTVVDSQEKVYYVFPLTNTVQKPFSDKSPSYSETMEDWRLHLGTDFAGDPGQTVKAIAKGTVAGIEQDKLYGDVVVIDHGVGVISRYCGVSATVKVGDELQASSPIGTLSDIPCESSQPAHVHIEVTVDGVPVDPVAVINLDVRYGETTDE